MFIAYWPVLGFVVGLVLAAVFTALLMASRVCRARHEALPERPLQSYLPETVSPGLPSYRSWVQRVKSVLKPGVQVLSLGDQNT